MITNLFKLFCLIGYSVSIIYIFSFLYGSGDSSALAKDTTSNSSFSTFPYLEHAAKQINEFTLDNGMKFIVMENHSAPVISFVTYADVGGVDEPKNKTGVAHFLEHLAFKGTTEIGTTNYTEEKEILSNLDHVFTLIEEAKSRNDNANVQLLTEEFHILQAEAHNYVKQNEFGRIVETAGGVNINAATSPDSTIYFYSFPSNKLELWMSLESQRFLNPVFREFYKEKNIILEERRLRTENNPIGKMVEAFLDTAFIQHPYKRPVIGYNKDINGLTRKDVQDFFNIYYGPNNLTISIVGDVKFEQVRNLAEVYFGRYPSKAEPPKISVVEPKQTEAREITLNLDSQPWYLEGYHVPSLDHPDNVVYQVISNILSSGRTSRLYKSLVEDKQVALVAQGLSGYPSDKYPNLMLFYAQTSPQASVEEVAKALSLEIEKLKVQPVSEQELEKAKNKLRASLLRSLDSNLGMARALVEYEVKTGKWHNLFSQVQALEAVTAEDIERVAKITFRSENMTVGRILPKRQ
ncbi:M16 family metallopeptidase [Candidatus Atelocyanobacterium thalassae]|uniref:Zinc protease n=1 Tax=cyanobacterium endosymbiont of Braarudosphaera bigelowii TaxID=1285375 RepID=A0ABM7U3W8_9CHRO|nr:pitrilysin family protein [Candidatus Atelocyanobacterium thalassa]BDA39393.1 putative zinc protease [cyanobacterium endosymbiont of Braarudosphaera bigelowii]